MGSKILADLEQAAHLRTRVFQVFIFVFSVQAHICTRHLDMIRASHSSVLRGSPLPTGVVGQSFWWHCEHWAHYTAWQAKEIKQ